MYENTTSDKAGGLAFWERRKTTSFDWNKQCAYKSQRVALGQRRKIGSIRSQCRSNLELLDQSGDVLRHIGDVIRGIGVQGDVIRVVGDVIRGRPTRNT